MCYYNGVKIAKATNIQLGQFEKTIAPLPFMQQTVSVGFDYNLFPVLKANADKTSFDLVPMEWGFIPTYIANRETLVRFRNGGTDPVTGKFSPPIITLNAIGEEVLEKPMYKSSALSRRCLVLSSGFFEWRHIYPIGKKTGKPLKTAVKYPYYISVKGQDCFYMAGIWTPWIDKSTGEYVESFSIITTRANALMEQIHNSKKRMPVILNEELATEWLMGNPLPARISAMATYQFPAEKMVAYSLAKDFLSSPDPLKEVQYKGLF